MIPRDWFDYTNFGVGLCGLMLTLWAVRQATGAKTAAIEAREAVWRREASMVVAEMVSLTADLAGHIEADQLEAARIRARDICARIARDKGRFRRFLVRDFGNLLDLEKSFTGIAERLSNMPSSERKQAVSEMVSRVFEANRMLNGIYGRLQSGLDEEGR